MAGPRVEAGLTGGELPPAAGSSGGHSPFRPYLPFRSSPAVTEVVSPAVTVADRCAVA